MLEQWIYRVISLIAVGIFLTLMWLQVTACIEQLPPPLGDYPSKERHVIYYEMDEPVGTTP